MRRTVVALVALSVFVAADAPAGAGIRFFRFTGRHAGYELTSTDSTRSLTVSFRVPAISCPASSAQIALAGATVFATSPASGTGGGIELFCDNGVVSYAGVLDAAPNHSEQVYASIRAGDRISVQTSSFSDYSTVDVTDVREHSTWSLRGDAVGSDLSAAIGVFAQVCSKDGFYAVPTFDTLRFQSINVDSVGGFTGARRRALRDSTHTVTVRANALHADGTQFTARFAASGTSGPC